MNLCSLLTRRSATIASILTTAILSSGCAALLIGGAAAGGVVAYSRGELNSVESASLERTYAATRAAVKELQFVETEAKSDSVEAVVEARTALDRKVKIRLKRVSDTGTEVRIRVDNFGDETISRQVLDRLHTKL